MRYLAILALLSTLVACGHKQPVSPVPPAVIVPIPKEEMTLTWERNSAPNIADYVFYLCEKKDCTDLKAVGTVKQPAVGTKPEFTLYHLAGKAGTWAVTARTASGKESAFGCFMPFDRR